MKKKRGKKRRKKFLLFETKKRRVLTAIFAFLLLLLCIDVARHYISAREQGVFASKYDYSRFNISEGFMTYEDDEYRGVIVIDVSEHQHKIDWEAVKKQGINHAMLRIGYRGTTTGEIREDAYFRDNFKEARSNGIKLGVYFFSQATTKEEAEEEARFVRDIVSPMELDLPVAFDMEQTSEEARIDILSDDEREEIASSFIRRIKDYGFKAMIYGNPHWFDSMVDLKKIEDCYIWLAHYEERPTFPYGFLMWQYSESGMLDGINGNVDMNILMLRK